MKKLVSTIIFILFVGQLQAGIIIVSDDWWADFDNIQAALYFPLADADIKQKIHQLLV